MVEIILTLLYTLGFILLIRRLKFFNLPGIGRNAITSVFIIKVISGFVLWFIYSKYYTDRATADVFKYFDDSKIMYDAVFSKPLDYVKMLFGIDNNNQYFSELYYNNMNNWYRVHESTLYNESHSLIRFNAVIRFFSFGYYNVHTVFMCFFSLSGLAGLYRFLFKYVRKNKNALFVSVFFLPTVLFWGSGVLKEGLILTGMGLMLWSFDKCISGNINWKYILLLIISFVLIRYTKVYVVLSLFPLIIALWWSKKSGFRKSFIKFFLTVFLILSAGFIISYMIPGMDVLSELSRKQRDFIGLAHSMNSGSLINVRVLEPDLWSLIKNSPEALYNVLFRPWFFERGSVLLIPASIENLALIIVAAVSLFFYKKPDKRSIAIIAFAVFFVLEIFILTGLTTPVLGAIVRYKLPALPFLFLIAFILIDYDKLIIKIPVLKNFNIIKLLSFNKI